MSMLILNTELVANAIALKGLKKVWVIRELKLNHTSGFNLLSNGVLPKNKTLQGRVLRKLAEMLDLEPASLVIRVGQQVAAKTA